MKRHARRREAPSLVARASRSTPVLLQWLVRSAQNNIRNLTGTYKRSVENQTLESQQCEVLTTNCTVKKINSAYSQYSWLAGIVFEPLATVLLARMVVRFLMVSFTCESC